MFVRSSIALLRSVALSRKRVELHPESVQSLTIIELTRLGDVIAILSAIAPLARRFGGATVHLIVDDRFVSLLQGFQLPATIHGISRSLTIAGSIRGLRLVRSLNPDIALSMSPANRNAFLALAGGARFAAGYLGYSKSLVPGTPAMEVETAGFKAASDESQSPETLSKRGARVCRIFGIDLEPPSDVLLRPEVAQRVRLLLQRDRAVPLEDYVVIHPFSHWEYRSWSTLKYVSLARAIVSRFGCHVIFIGAPHEEERLQWIRQQCGPDDRFDSFSPHDLLQSAVLIKGASLFVGNDSGPLHLAAALGIKVIGLFGPASPDLTAPCTKDGTFIYRKLECSPCGQLRCVRPTDSCMMKITAEEVIAEAFRMYESGHPVSRSAHA